MLALLYISRDKFSISIVFSSSSPTLSTYSAFKISSNIFAYSSLDDTGLSKLIELSILSLQDFIDTKSFDSNKLLPYTSRFFVLSSVSNSCFSGKFLQFSFITSITSKFRSRTIHLYSKNIFLLKNFISEIKPVNIITMNAQLLTVNNITKICDDKYYFKRDNTLSELQWYDYQIDFILDNLDVDQKIKKVDNITGYRFSRNQIYNTLLKLFNTNNFNLKKGIKESKLKEYGLFKDDVMPLDIYTFDSLGGLSQPKVNYNYSNNTVEKPQRYIYGKLIELGNIDPKKKKIKKKKLTLSKTKFNRFRNNIRRTNGLRAIRITNNPLEKLGKFDWYKNSCYADSVLLSLFYNALQNKMEYFIAKSII